MMFARIFIVVIVSFVIVSGCSLDMKISEKSKTQVLVEKRIIKKINTASYVKFEMPRTAFLKRKVNINRPDISIQGAITSTKLNINVVPVDSGVNMKKHISVYARNMSFEDYLKQLSGVSNYDYRLKGKTLYISSVTRNRWNVASLVNEIKSTSIVGQSSSQEGGGSSSQNGLIITNSTNEWDNIISNAKSILGIKDENENENVDENKVTTDSAGTEALNKTLGSENKKEEFKPWVAGIKRLGTIEAAGSPFKMTLLDDWLSELEKSSRKQVNLDVKTLNVTLDDNKSRGINWSSLFSEGASSLSIAGSFAGSFAKTDAWSVKPSISNPSLTYDSLFTFLSNYGKVEVKAEPNVTTVNGSTAYVSSANEFSYLASIEQVTSTDGVISRAPTLAKVKIGVSLAVTPRILKNDEILIEVVPIISSLRGFDDFEIEGSSFSAPNIAIQELATQAITRSGEPIQIGGLITSKLANAISKLPIDGIENSAISLLTSSENNTLVRNELVITVTPRIVGL